MERFYKGERPSSRGDPGCRRRPRYRTRRPTSWAGRRARRRSSGWSPKSVGDVSRGRPDQLTGGMQVAAEAELGPRDVDRGHHAPGEVADGGGHRHQTRLRLLVGHGIADLTRTLDPLLQVSDVGRPIGTAG